MAILKKGILGTPKGKIGKVMCYTRKSKNVVQTLPTVKDPIKRLGKLYLPPIEERIRTIANGFPAFRFPKWYGVVGNRPDMREAIYYYLLDEYKLNYRGNLDGLLYLPWITPKLFDIYPTLDRTNQVINFTMSNLVNSTYWPVPAVTRVSYLNENGTQIALQASSFNGDSRYQTYDLDPTLYAQSSFFAIYVRSFVTNYDSWQILLDKTESVY